MNLCLIPFQAVLLAVLVVHYHYINEVEAENQASFSVGNWFNSIEKKIDIQGTMNEVLRQIRKKADEFVDYTRRLIQQAMETSTDNKSNIEDGNDFELVKSQELADPVDVSPYDTSDVSIEVKVKNEAESEPPLVEVIDNQQAAKKKRRSKRHKKKGRAKHEHDPYEQKRATSTEKDKAEFGKRFTSKNHKKRLIRRKFKKVAVKDGNNSESEETNSRNPVDIIVHIKMNE